MGLGLCTVPFIRAAGTGIDKTLEEAPQFYKLYAAIITVAVVIILIPNAPLVTITLWTQIINGILLPVVLISMILLVNNKDIMGPHTNSKTTNLIGWTTVSILVLLSLTLLGFSIAGFFRK